MLSPALRKLTLATHIVVSVAFPGAVVCFLVLAIIGMGAEPSVAHAMYLAMERVTYYVIVPLCLASLVSGLASSLGTPWGLFRYWWVVVKLLATLLSTVILLVHLRPISLMAETLPDAHAAQTQVQLAATAAAAIAALVFMTALSVYKPRGLTRYGSRRLAR